MALKKEIKLLGTGKMNTDLNDLLLSQNDNKGVVNGRITVNSRNIGVVTNVKGNLFKDSGLHLTDDAKVVATVSNIRDNSIIYFFTTISGSGIMEYFPELDSFETILYGHAKFTDYIKGAFLIGDLLYWNDGEHELNKINIKKGKAYYNGDTDNGYESIDDQTISYIKYPPLYSPIVQYITDESKITNNLRGILFQFRYGYVYDDDEESTLSPISKVPIPDEEYDYDGSVLGGIRINNMILLTIKSGHQTVKEIKLYVRIGNNGNWGLFDTIDNQLDSDVIEYKFYNETYTAVDDQDYVNRLYDKIPLKAKYLNYLHTNEIVITGVYEGYENIETNVTLSYETVDVESTIKDEYVRDIPKSDGELVTWEYDYNIGDWVVLKRYEGEFFDLSDTPDAGNILTISSYTPGGTLIEREMLVTSQMAGSVEIFRSQLAQTISNEFAHIKAFTEWDEDPYTGGGNPIGDEEIFTTTPMYGSYVAANYSPVVIKEYTNLPGANKPYSSFKSGAHHYFGMIYYDQCNRSGNVNPCGSIYLPFITELKDQNDFNNYRFTINWELNHKPPEWARTYQFVYAKNRNIGTFRQYIILGAELDGDKVNLDISPLNKHNSQHIEDEQGLNFCFPNSSIEPYTFTKGDRVRFITKSHTDFDPLTGGWPGLGMVLDYLLDVEILEYKTELDAIGDTYVAVNKLITEWFDINKEYADIGENTLIEIYTPLKIQEDYIYYEIGEVYDVLNYGKSNRSHSGNIRNQTYETIQRALNISAKGYISNGDVYVVPTTFTINLEISTSDKSISFCESQSYSNFKELKDYCIGRPNIINKKACQKWYNILRLSGKYFEGTEINGLSSVDNSKEAYLSEQFGDICGAFEIGYTLKVLQESKNTSFYVGRDGLQTADGGEIQANSDNTIGTKSPSFTPFGCLNAESILITERYAYFVDIKQNAIIRDASNGMEAISDLGISNEIKTICTELLLSSSYNIITGFNPISKEVMFGFIGRDKSGNYDYKGTYIWSESKNEWKGKNTYTNIDNQPPEIYGYVGGNTFVSFLKGELWRHEVNPLYNNYYGVQVPLEISIIFNSEMLSYKSFKVLELIGKGSWGAPDKGDICIKAEYSDNGIELESRIKAAKFNRISSRQYASLLKAMSDTVSSLFNGHDLKGLVLEIKLVNNESTEAYISTVSIDYQSLDTL